MARNRQSEVVHATTAAVAMRSTAASVVAYIDEQPPEWQPTLRKLRAACRRQLPGYAERMVYGMPSYERQGPVEVSFGKQARYLSAEEPFTLHGKRARRGGGEPTRDPCLYHATSSDGTRHSSRA